MKNEKELEAFYKTIGSNVKRLRKEQGLAQLQLSHLMGFKSVSLVSQAETYYNQQHFAIRHLFMIATILNRDIEEFFKDVKIVPLDWEL